MTKNGNIMTFKYSVQRYLRLLCATVALTMRPRAEPPTTARRTQQWLVRVVSQISPKYTFSVCGRRRVENSCKELGNDDYLDIPRGRHAEED